MKSQIAIVAITLLIVYPQISSATDVSGDVWGEWTAAGNPYNVVGDLRVPPGSTLVVGPGCYIEFQGQYHLFVDTTSTLQINGVDSDSVTFTAADTISGWEGIRLLSADSSFIRYSIIKYGGVENDIGEGEIYCHNSHMKVENCRFSLSLATNRRTIYIDRYSTYEIRDNFFNDNSPFVESATFVHYSSQGIIEDNIFTGYHNGFVLDIGSECIISRNAFYGNNNCIVIFSCSADSVLIDENIIYENDGLIFWFHLTGYPLIIRNNLIYNNYCDAPETPGIIGCDDAAVRLINNTISNNYGGGQTYLGGFYEEFNGCPAVLINNIIWGNHYSLNNIFQVDYGVSLSVSYSNIQGNWPGGGNIDADPLFVDSANADFHLMPGSPCIDTGDPASPLDPDSTRADMGAFYFDQTTGIKLPPPLPRNITLHQNYPNPFNAGTNIPFAICRQSNVTINIFDMLGRRVCSLLDNQLQAGEYSITWDGRSDSGERLSSGVYFYNLKADRFEDSKKMVILK